MPGNSEPDSGASAVCMQPEKQGSDKRCVEQRLRVDQQCLIDHREHAGRFGLVDCGGAHAVTSARCTAGGLGALAAHVTDGQTPRPGVDREDVVEVAADLKLAGGLESSREVDAGDVGERRWRQAPLQSGRQTLRLLQMCLGEGHGTAGAEPQLELVDNQRSKVGQDACWRR